jgi:hypothetical protein
MRHPNPEKKRIDYLCDRCGRKFADSRSGEKPNLSDRSVRRGTNFQMPVLEVGDEISFRTKDLCGSCTRAFCKWMSPKKRTGTKGRKSAK